jgi:glycine/D-amino acid oxidase-like deaminating enzyme
VPEIRLEHFYLFCPLSMHLRLLASHFTDMTNPPASSRKVVVVGGGIIGCSTAYQLKQRGADVTILEASSIAAGASGKAGGFLAYDWCDGQATESLTHLGFKMHRQFADLFGADSTGYRALETASVAFDVAGKGRGKKVPGADWINDSAVRQSAKLGGTDTTAQVHPRLLTERLAKEVGSTVIAQAEGIEYGTDGRPVAVLARERDASEQIRLDCTDVVLAAGPWSGKLVNKLFKDDPAIDTSDYNVVGSRAHSIVLKSSEPLSAVALFTSIRTGKKSSEPELYCRPDGTGYLCGPTGARLCDQSRRQLR